MNAEKINNRPEIRTLVLIVMIACGLFAPHAVALFCAYTGIECPLQSDILTGCYCVSILLLGLLVAITKEFGDSLCFWGKLSIPLGLIACLVPVTNGTFPSKQGEFFGIGFPFPVVFWDKGLDHPFPLSLVCNPVLIVILGVTLILIVNGSRYLFRACRGRRDCKQST